MPSPNSAVTIGSPIARNEPKLISSTTIAARTPIARVADPGGATSRLLDRLAAELDLERRRARGLGGGDHVVDRSPSGARSRAGRTHGREADRAVGRRSGPWRPGRTGWSPPRRAAAARRAAPASARPRRGRPASAQAARRVEDDLVGVARLRREAARSRSAARCASVFRARSCSRSASRPSPAPEHHDQHDDPEGDDEAAVIRAEAGEREHSAMVHENGVFTPV